MLKRRPPRISDRAAWRLRLGYLVLCVAAGVLIEAITSWPLGGMVILVAVFYLLLTLAGALVLRPIATMAMLVFRSVRRENRRDIVRRTGRVRGPRRIRP